MSQAILINGGLNIDPEALNSIIEKYEADTEIISANNYVDFINKSTFTWAPASKLLHNNTHAGQIVSKYIENTSNQFYDTQPRRPYYMSSGAHTYKNAQFQLDEETILYFHTNQEAHDGRYNYVFMFTIKDGDIVANKVELIPGSGSNLGAIQLTDSRFFVISGSYRSATGSGWMMTYCTIDVDLENKTFAINTARNDGRYYYTQLAEIFKIADNKVIAFMGDGNGGARFYHQCVTLTINKDGTTETNTRLLTGAYHEHACNYYYMIHPINEYKYVEVAHYDYPIITIVSVDPETNVATRSGHITLSATAKYTNEDYIGQSFLYDNFVYVPYFNGANWVMAQVDCSGTAPIFVESKAFAAAGTARPIIERVSERQFICLQQYSSLAYGTLMYLSEDDGTITSTAVSLTVGFRIGDILKYVRTGAKQGYLLCYTYGQSHGMVAIPLTYNKNILEAGEPQMWNESFAWDNSYFFVDYVKNGTSVCVYQPYVYNVRNSVNCFAIYQDGLTLRKGPEYTIHKGDIHATTNNRQISDFMIDHETGEIALLFRDFELAGTSYWDLYFTNFYVLGTECYLGKVEKIRNGTETANRNYHYARLMRTSKHDYAALYNYDDNTLHGTGITLNSSLKIIPSEITGHIAGWTKSMCAPGIEGQVVLVSSNREE